MVELLNSLRVAVHWSDLGHLGDDVGACLAHLPLIVLRQLFVQGEQPLREDVSGDMPGDVCEVLSKRATHLDVLVETESLELRDDEALVDLLSHVCGNLVEKLDG